MITRSAAHSAAWQPAWDPTLGPHGNNLLASLSPVIYGDLNQAYEDTGGATPAETDLDPVGLIRGLPYTDAEFLQATVADKPKLRVSGASKWLEFNGTTHNLMATFTGGSGPADCSVIMAVRTTDTAAVLFKGETPATDWFGVIEQGSGASTFNPQYGTPTIWVNLVQITDTRDNLFNAGADGSWNVIEYRNIDLSGQSEFGFGDYGSFEYAGDINQNFMVIPSSQFLTDNRTAVHNLVAQGTGWTA